MLGPSLFFSVFAAALATWWLWPSNPSSRLLTVLGGAKVSSSSTYRLKSYYERLLGSSKSAHEQRNQTISAVSSLAAELHAGSPPTVAIAITGGEPCAWPRTKKAAQIDSDVAAALSADAEANPQLRALHACWIVAANSGSGLALSIEKLAQSMRVSQDVRIELEAELAGPRATARMLALLPLVGIGLGYLMGAEPLTWLLSNPFGWLTLTIGVALTAAGVWWTGRIAARVEQML